MLRAQALRPRLAGRAGRKGWIFLAEADPRDPADRRVPPRTSISMENQPRQPILRPSGGERKIQPDRLEVPSPTGSAGTNDPLTHDPLGGPGLTTPGSF